MKSMRQSCICGQEGLCESISKIIHFAVATHFRLPVPITNVSGEGDRSGRGMAGGRFCLICHQRPGDPHSLSCPLFTYSSHLLPYSSVSPHPSTAVVAYIKIKGGPIVTPDSRCPLCPSFSLRLAIDYTSTHGNYYQRTSGVLFVLNQFKLLPEKLQFSNHRRHRSGGS